MPLSAPRPRHVPERTCVACRRKRPQDELVRVTRTPAGWRVLPGQRTGRGAYLCADSPECWQEKRLRRAFRGDAGAINAELRTPNLSNPSMDQPMTT